MATKEIQTKENNAIEIPQDYDMGFDTDDVKVPQILVWQKMSDMPEFEGTGVKAGDLVNPVTGEILGTSVECAVIRCFITARKYGEKDPLTGRKTIVKYSKDGVHWDEDGARIHPQEFKWNAEGDYAMKAYHYVVLPKDSIMPCVLVFRGASAKHAKGLNANLMYIKPSWRTWFKISTVMEETNGNKYFVLKSQPQPKKPLSAEEAEMCYGFYQSSTVDKAVTDDDPVYE